MKISLALGKRQTLSTQTAWGCTTANMAMPGAGSLAAGYRSGYAQLALASIGTILTTTFGVRFLLWYAANWSRFGDLSSDPGTVLKDLWGAVRWAVVGMALFAIAWIWSLITSSRLMAEAKKAATSRVPPKL